MPQLDSFTYVNLCIYFFVSFFLFYIFVTYSVFPIFNLVQKCRLFFRIVVESRFDYSLYIHVFSKIVKNSFFKFNYQFAAWKFYVQVFSVVYKSPFGLFRTKTEWFMLRLPLSVVNGILFSV